jgi:hypothetical protein
LHTFEILKNLLPDFLPWFLTLRLRAHQTVKQMRAPANGFRPQALSCYDKGFSKISLFDTKLFLPLSLSCGLSPLFDGFQRHIKDNIL